MHISCPECRTKFLIQEKILGKGRRVKCSKCGHNWYQDPLEVGSEVSSKAQERSEQESKDITATQGGAARTSEAKTAQTLPKIQKNHLPMLLPPHVSSSSTHFGLVTFGLIIALLVMLFINSDYEKYLFRYKYLEISELRTQYNSASQEFTIRYNVHNPSNYKIRMPKLRTSLLHNNGIIMKSITEDHSEVVVLPHSAAEVTTSFRPVKNAVYKVELQMGNCVE